MTGAKAGCAVLGFLLLGGLAAAGYGLYANWYRIPPNHLPWEPLRLEAEPGWFARLRLNSLADDGMACRAALARVAAFTPLADRQTGTDCGFRDVVRVETSTIAMTPRVTATCGMAAALYWYEQRLVRVAIQELGSPVVRIEQIGTYACRNVNSAQTGRRSQHATANAIDIAAFHLADGRRISVLKHWGAGAEGRFLAAAHEAGCAFFNVVLGPDYNRFHADHFHLDMGGARICR